MERTSLDPSFNAMSLEREKDLRQPFSDTMGHGEEGEEEEEEEEEEAEDPPSSILLAKVEGGGGGGGLLLQSSGVTAPMPKEDRIVLVATPLEEEKPPSRGGRSRGGGGGGGSAQARVNWSYRETVVLLDAKKKDSEENSRALGRAGAGGRQSQNMERWDRIADFCLSHGVKKTGGQCSNRWDKLWPRFKKIFDYERARVFEIDSYWRMLLHTKQRMGLPDSFNRDIFDAIAERFGAERAAKTSVPTPPVPIAAAITIPRAEITADKASTTSTLVEGNKGVEPTPFAGEEIDNGTGEPFIVAGKKRKKESETQHQPAKETTTETQCQDSTGSSTKQFFQMYERLESTRQKCYERTLEGVKTMMRDKLVSEDRTTAMICSSLNRIADALNNVAAMAAKK